MRLSIHGFMGFLRIEKKQKSMMSDDGIFLSIFAGFCDLLALHYAGAVIIPSGKTGENTYLLLK